LGKKESGSQKDPGSATSFSFKLLSASKWLLLLIIGHSSMREVMPF
jgi:hypothetical protein